MSENQSSSNVTRKQKKSCLKRNNKHNQNSSRNQVFQSQAPAKPKKMKQSSLKNTQQVEQPTMVYEGKTIDKLKRFRVGKFIGGGSFGSVHYGTDAKSSKTVAVKFESTKIEQRTLALEYNFYKKFPYYSRLTPQALALVEVNADHTALVMEVLGPSLHKIHQVCEKRFSTACITAITIQLLNIFEFVHDCGILHRDIKPENFVLGLPETDEWKRIFIIDFGTCKEFRDENKRHIPYETGLLMVGTARYVSINNMRFSRTSRRDDLEAMFYMIVSLFCGSLPWQTAQYNDILAQKETLQPREFFKGLPIQFPEVFEEIRATEFEAKPRYRWMIGKMMSILRMFGLLISSDPYDWDQKHQFRQRDGIRIIMKSEEL